MQLGPTGRKTGGGAISLDALYVTETESYLTHPPETDRALQAEKTLHTADFIEAP